MPVPVLATVKIGKKSGIANDRPTMDFVFSANDILVASLVAIEASIEQFFKTATGGGSALQTFLSKSLSSIGSLSETSFYNLTGHLDGSPHGGPIATFNWGLSATGAGVSLPDQIACALSMHSNYGTDVEFGVGGTRPRARDRGRVFIGPLDSGTIVSDATTNEPKMLPLFSQTLADAASRLLTEQPGWSVWSRRDAALKTITGGWVDNRPDVQRRRAQLATSRISWS